MAQVHSDTVNTMKMEEGVTQCLGLKSKLTQQLNESTRYLKVINSHFYRSFLHLMGYIAAGTGLWILMHWQFGMAFPGNVDVPNERLRFKDIWNAAMYIVPYCFWGMATKHAAIMIITGLDICISEFELFRLKKKLAK
ncbi:hypothetical protein GKR67_18845 [Providencia alcalifaciens]|uniref:Conjugal transfer protein TrbF n=1 Tax=Providencia alcalifaciens TaxID=126385 RepID=A0AAW9VEW8_9GAMM|nr:hypothetical protein [Providencia alcalifaciens]